jgi:transposase InsO family protein
MKYEAIMAQSSIFSVRKMCIALGLREANYYKWKCQRDKKIIKKLAELIVVKQIEDIFLESKNTYGYRKIFEVLKKLNIEISQYKVRRIMRENGLYPITITKYKPYRNGKTNSQFSENIVARQFKIEEYNKIWAGDITYIRTKLGWVYLAVVIDLCNREIVGYQISKTIDTELVKSALGNAIAKTGKAENLIFHSDRGCQYTSAGYRKMLEENNIISSMSRPGCPCDNSPVESLFATMKKELIYRKNYDRIEEVENDIFEYIEIFYNRKRIHSTLGYMSPVEYRLNNCA